MNAADGIEFREPVDLWSTQGLIGLIVCLVVLTIMWLAMR